MPSIFFEPACETETTNIIKEFKIGKTNGGDEISSYFIKLSSTVLVPVLVLFVNSAFKLGIFPDYLKLTKVSPVFKKGYKLDLSLIFAKLFIKQSNYFHNTIT